MTNPYVSSDFQSIESQRFAVLALPWLPLFAFAKDASRTNDQTSDWYSGLTKDERRVAYECSTLQWNLSTFDIEQNENSRRETVFVARLCNALEAVGPRAVVFGEYRLALYASWTGTRFVVLRVRAEILSTGYSFSFVSSNF